MARNNDQQPIYCSFCGKRENQAARLIAGPGVYICSDCVTACSDLLRDEYDLEETPGIQAPERLPTPMEMMIWLAASIMFLALRGVSTSSVTLA